MKLKNTVPILQLLGQCILVLVLAISLWMCKKDVEPDDSAVVGNVYAVATVDKPPTPQGGQTGLNSYLQKKPTVSC